MATAMMRADNMNTQSSPRKKRQRRSAVEVANAQNILILRKMVQEGLVPGERISQLIQEFLPLAQAKKSAE
jgi:hypothetical protein